MNDLSIEQRISNALHEVANRLPETDLELMPQGRTLASRRRPWLTPLAAAAVVLAVLAAGVFTRDDDRVPLATGVPGPTDSIDRGGPARPPKGTLGDAPMTFAFWRGGAVWVRAGDQRDIRLTDGTLNARDGYPSVAPNGRSIAYSVSSSEGIFDQPRIIDARNGMSADPPAFVRTFSPDGSMIAGGQPVDDSGAATELVVLRSDDFGEVARVNIGINEAVGDIARVAWDQSGKRLLVVTRVRRGADPGQPTDRLWAVDLAQRAAVELGEAREGVEWIVAEQAIAPGVFNAIRRSGTTADWGILRIGTSAASFERLRALPTSTGDAELEPTGVLYLDLFNADGSRYLIGDGKNLFMITQAGELMFVLADVAHASAP